MEAHAAPECAGHTYQQEIEMKPDDKPTCPYGDECPFCGKGKDPK